MSAVLHTLNELKPFIELQSKHIGTVFLVVLKNLL